MSEDTPYHVLTFNCWQLPRFLSPRSTDRWERLKPWLAARLGGLDVVCLQEMWRPDHRQELLELAEREGLEVLGTQGNWNEQGGLMTLVRGTGVGYTRFASKGVREDFFGKKGYQLAYTDRVWILNTHLQAMTDWGVVDPVTRAADIHKCQREQVNELLRAVRNLHARELESGGGRLGVLVCGDLNFHFVPDHDADMRDEQGLRVSSLYNVLAREGWIDLTHDVGPTYLADPDQRLDYIWWAPFQQVSITSTATIPQVPRRALSDHEPVLATIGFA